MNKFSVLTQVPEFTKGLVRELRVRWAHEEMGLPYEEIRYPHPETKKAEYMKKQPFGQVPYFTSGDICMFETGAILLHLALKHDQLLPKEEMERAQTLTWMFAALNSVEPFLFHYSMLKSDPEVLDTTKSKAKKIAQQRLQAMSEELGARKFLVRNFSVADIVMTTVFKTGLFLNLLEDHENLVKFVERNEARPAFQRAINEHIKLYKENV
jgi:glutathione S-transferase